MKLPGVPYQPHYTMAEILTGVVVAVVLHVGVIAPFVYKAVHPSADKPEEQPLVSRPVVQAAILKLGKPIDPKKLPDRIVPQQRTAPKKRITASREDPGMKRDAGAPPDNAKDSDITNLIAKSDPFAEDAGKARPEEGHELGVDGGTETDPNKVRAGDAYALLLGQFFGKHLTVPSVISVGQAQRLCSVFQINIGRNMVIWYVKTEAVHGSGNELFDDAARSMLLKLRDDRVPLPEPPKEVEGLYRQRTVQIQIPGDTHGATNACPK